MKLTAGTTGFWLLLFLKVIIVWGCAEKQRSDTSGLVKTISIKLPANSSAVMKNIAGVLARCVETRSGAKVSVGAKADLQIEFAIKAGIGREGFRIDSDPGGSIVITGNDERGVLYGVGKFLRASVYSEKGFIAGKWRGISVPDKPVRGMYFATHFYNFYQNAPVEEVQRYVEDLALWGVNTFLVWYDMHHFNGFDDAAAINYRVRLKKLLTSAKNLGIATGFIMIANEGYANSPVALQALEGAGRGAYFKTDICPNKPGGMDYILSTKSAFFDWCMDVAPEYICIWPYDQGGCATKDCKPWGANGFLKCTKAISALAQKKLGDVNVITSTWYLDSIEWKGLSDQVTADSSWTNMILVEGEAPGKEIIPLPAVGFPEISMYNTFPWGGFGATPLPEHINMNWKKVKDKLAGGFPYSEGIFDDITKVTCTQLYWNTEASVTEILKEYIAYEYSPFVVDSVLKVIRTLEQNHHWRWWPGKLKGVKLMLDWFPSENAKPQADPGAEEAYSIIRETDKILPGWVRQSWRWRLVYIRTMLDAELKTSGGSPNEACIKGFKELMKIYHTTEQSDPAVRPPVPVTDN